MGNWGQETGDRRDVSIGIGNERKAGQGPPTRRIGDPSPAPSLSRAIRSANKLAGIAVNFLLPRYIQHGERRMYRDAAPNPLHNRNRNLLFMTILPSNRIVFIGFGEKVKG